jgi:OOP family OmpA-OmpF porin
MSLKINKTFALFAVLASIAFSNTMAQDRRDIVVNDFGNKVVNNYGNCVRVKWDTGLDKCGPKAAATTPAHAESRSYLIFFDFDKSDLTEDAIDVLNRLYSDAVKQKASMFYVTGHADRSGSDEYNMALSQRRADTVKRALINMGANSRNIATKAEGERMPLVPTADGVREPQNRRTEIVFGSGE